MKDMGILLSDIERSVLYYNKETTAVKLNDRSEWITFIVPDDGINKTRKLCGAPEEAIILSHEKNMDPPKKCIYEYTLDHSRFKNKLLVLDGNASPVAVLDIRNKELLKKGRYKK